MAIFKTNVCLWKIAIYPGEISGRSQSSHPQHSNPTNNPTSNQPTTQPTTNQQPNQQPPTDRRAAAAGLPAIDSLDVWPFLSGQAKDSPRSGFAADKNCMVEGDWKLITSETSRGHGRAPRSRTPPARCLRTATSGTCSRGGMRPLVSTLVWQIALRPPSTRMFRRRVRVEIAKTGAYSTWLRTQPSNRIFIRPAPTSLRTSRRCWKRPQRLFSTTQTALQTLVPRVEKIAPATSPRANTGAFSGRMQCSIWIWRRGHFPKHARRARERVDIGTLMAHNTHIRAELRTANFAHQSTTPRRKEPRNACRAYSTFGVTRAKRSISQRCLKNRRG